MTIEKRTVPKGLTAQDVFDALTEANGSIERAARLLGTHKNTVRYWIEHGGITVRRVVEWDERP